MGFGNVARLIHWLTVLIVAVMIPVGLTMVQDIPKSIQNPLFILHKGLGACFLTIIVLRLAWRIFNPPPPLPADLPRAQRIAAHLTHWLLYALLLTMAVSGYVFVTAGGFPIEALDALGIPPLLPKMVGVSKAAQAVHHVAKSVLIVVISVHVAAAAYHGLVRKDGVFLRMWPPFRA